MMKLKSIIAAILLAALSALPALAQGVGQLGPGQVWGQPTASAGRGQAASVSAILDRALGSTRGALIERGASGWGLIGPGTLNGPLISGGASGDPSFCAPSGTCLDDITGFSSTGYLKRTGAGAYSLVSPIPIADGGTNAGTQQAALNNIAPTPTRAGDLIYWNGSNWVNFAGNNSGSQFLQENSSGVPSWVTVSGTGTVTTPGAGLVSSTTSACSQSANQSTFSAADCVNAQTGTSYAIQDSDRAKLITASNSAAQAYTIAQAGASTTFQAGWFTEIANIQTPSNPAGVVTITPTTSTINGNTTLLLYPGERVKLVSDGTNYQASYIVAVNGPWHLLNTVTASNSANLQDTTSLTSAFTDYEIVLENILPATTGTTVEIELQVSGTFQTSNYASTQWNNGGTSGTTSFIFASVPSGVINTTGMGDNCRLFLANPSSTGIGKFLWGECAHLATSTTTSAVNVNGTYLGSSAAITGIELLMSSGNITSGTMKIYGRVK